MEAKKAANLKPKWLKFVAATIVAFAAGACVITAPKAVGVPGDWTIIPAIVVLVLVFSWLEDAWSFKVWR